jgi:hypothetical protein
MAWQLQRQGRSHFNRYQTGGTLGRGILYRPDLLKKAVRNLATGVIALLVFCPLRLSGQISPGPLSRPHQFLSGTTQCTSCHRLAGGNQRFKCLECHKEISQRIAAHRGYHASLMQQPDDDQCVRCHSEHNGADFQIVHWVPSKEGFDHTKTGYPLEGKHANLRCEQCHNAAHIPPAEHAALKTKDLNRTFLGLSRACSTCHQDPHQCRLGNKCEQCHDFSDWKKVSHFDHSKTRFVLTGEHARVACEKCHKPQEQNPKLIQLVGISSSNCTDCHRDPHHGAFQARCESCHTTAGWKQISEARVNSHFDHSRTKYPLLGKHAKVRCAQCHHGGNFKRPLAFARCLDCHTDPHSGQFTARKDGGDCLGCHTVSGFMPSTFGLREHAATSYPLEGKHAKVACAKCHVPAGVKAVYKIKKTACQDCHTDPHKAQFAGAPYKGQCKDCHTPQGFKPSTFTLARHQATQFPLTGGHIAIPCAQCHEAKIPPGSKGPAPYRFQTLDCTECHTDPHHGEFRARMDKLRPNGKLAGCEACHSTESWTARLRFDHSTTAFPLVGTHRAVPCIDCHKPPNMEVSLRNVDFKSAPTHCHGCHQDPHDQQFAQHGVNPECSGCHNSSRWRPSLFDHETRTIFPLKGAHQNVPCKGCHRNLKLVLGKSVLIYEPTPTKCVDCHGPNLPKRG